MERERISCIRRSASTYSFDGEHIVEYLNGESPVEGEGDDKKYTVSLDQFPKKKVPKPTSNALVLPPVLGDNPTLGKKWQCICFRIVSSSPFEGFIIACIMLNTILMALEHHGMSKTFASVLETFNYVSVLFFL